MLKLLTSKAKKAMQGLERRKKVNELVSRENQIGSRIQNGRDQLIIQVPSFMTDVQSCMARSHTMAGFLLWLTLCFLYTHLVQVAKPVFMWSSLQHSGNGIYFYKICVPTANNREGN